MTRRQAEILLAAVIVTRSSAYLFSKIGLETLEVFNFLSLRFLTAFLFLLLLFGKRLLPLKRSTVLRGMLLGLTFFGIMTAELNALKTTNMATVSFLENTAIVLVPFFEAVLRRKLPAFSVIASGGAALTGVGLLTMRGNALSFTRGELLCLLAAALYASTIILTDRFSRKEKPLSLGILQVGFIGIFATFASFTFGAPALPTQGREWVVILILAIVCTGFGFTLQPVAQSKTTSERASLFCAVNPLTAVVLGYVVLHEKLGIQGMLGALLILGSITIPQFLKNRKSNVQE
ncbi:MAG: DMT family transporter [Clostridia bacterium]|nr:DMT family transporter [Clostridia bacterium]